MKKFTLVAIAGLMSIGLVAGVTPSFAKNIASCQDDVSNNGVGGAGEYSSFIDADSTAIIASLRQKGVNVSDISDWGGCVKADVVQKDGHTAQEFFDPDTLQRVHVNNG